MTMHISDDDLHDYAGGELPPRAREAVALHLDGCADCRARAEPLLALTARLAALPREAAPSADGANGAGRTDGWCALHARLVLEEAGVAPAAVPAGTVVPLDAHRRRRASLPAWVPRAAAAAVLVGIGFGGGRLSGTPDSREAVLVAADTVATAMSAAMRVQAAGSEYVAAVAHFVAASRGDSAIAAQGREATIAACYGASRELTRMPDDDSLAVRLFRAASIIRNGPAPAPDTAVRARVMF